MSQTQASPPADKGAARRRPVLPGPAGPERFLDLRLRWRLGHGLLVAAALAAAAALFRPLAPGRPPGVRVTVAVALIAALLSTGVLASLKGRGRTETLAFYVFVLLAADGLGQLLAPAGWPSWPLPAVLLAILAVIEPLPVGLAAAGLASLLAAAEAAATSFRSWEPAVAAALGYGVLVLALDRALSGEKRRLSATLAALARVEHGIDHLQEENRPAAALTLRGLSEDARRHRRRQEARELEERLGRLTRLAQAALPAHAVLYFDLDRDRGQAYLRAAAGPPSVVGDAVLPLSGDPFSFVIERGQRFYVTDYKRLLWSLPWHRGEVKVGSLLAVPVRTADVVTGVLVAERLETQSFTGREPELLEAVGELAADAVTGARVAVAREDVGQEFKALYPISRELAAMHEAARIRALLLASARELVSVEAAAVVMADSPPTRYVVHEAYGWAADYQGRQVGLSEKTWAAWVVRSAEEPFLLDDLGGQEERMPVLVLDEGGGRAESLLALPLRSQGRTLGALVMSGRRGAFSAAHQRVLGILANQAASALATSQYVEEKEHQAVRDRLTDLYNRRAFDDLLAGAIARADRRGSTVALLMLDLDNFKKLNDTYGHPAGDAVLRHTAGVLRKQLRQGDQAARFGGEEFAVILPDTDEPGALHLAERVREAMQQARLVFAGAKLAVTVSVGAAVWPRQAQEADTLLEAADRALYAAKEAGRNRVRSA